MAPDPFSSLILLLLFMFAGAYLRAAEAAQEALRDLAGVTVSGVQADFSGQNAVCTVALETDLYGSLEVVLELPKEDASGDV